jgi:hypothetical protein
VSESRTLTIPPDVIPAPVYVLTLGLVCWFGAPATPARGEKGPVTK